MEPSSSQVLSGLGGDATGFRAQQLTGEMADAADLTLTMTRRHRRAVLKVSPRSMFRTYTLREAADLLLSFGPATWPHLLARAMLAEQLFRATSILANHPYHREG